MLIYSKKVTIEATGTEPTKTVTRLFGTTNTAPSVTDQELVYRNAEGEVIDAETAYSYKYFYNKDNTVYAGNSDRQIPDASDTALNVYLADGTPVVSNLVPVVSSIAIRVYKD